MIMSSSKCSLDILGIGDQHPAYFIAEIGSNFDQDKQRAFDLIALAQESGAQAVKFQHYTAKSLVSDKGFSSVGKSLSHQSDWKDSVYKIYDKASLQQEWTKELAAYSKQLGIEFFTSPYSQDLATYVCDHVNLFKIGSGDISYTDLISHIASMGKPILMATGAASMEDVTRAVAVTEEQGAELVLMQCNTNYTGKEENKRYLNLAVLNTFKKKFPNAVIGLSDHMPDDEIAIAAVAMGAKVIERHFTDDTTRDGPDHAFSLTPTTWRVMVDKVRDLEVMLGDGVKRVEGNEVDTIIAQRRSICLKHDIPAGHKISVDDLDYLRPFPANAFSPHEKDQVIGRVAKRSMVLGSVFTQSDFV